MQEKQLKDIRVECPEYAAIHTHALQDVLTRLERAYDAFFRRLKAGETPGFPRFRGHGRYRSVTFKDAVRRNGARLVASGRRLEVHGVGKLRIRMHRPMTGTLKQVCITLAGDGFWYASMICVDVPKRPVPHTGKSIGIDVGIRTFATLSNGEEVDNPRPYLHAQAKLRAAHRRVSRRNQGSQRRKKAVGSLRRRYAKVQRTRLDFQHKIAADLIRRFDSIAVEDLDIRRMAKSVLAKHIYDAGWAQFIEILVRKAGCAGREVIKVNPRGTSQECSRCGVAVYKTLAIRTHACPNCGLVLGRDHNAAIVIEGRGRRLQGGIGPSCPKELRSPPPR